MFTCNFVQYLAALENPSGWCQSGLGVTNRLAGGASAEGAVDAEKAGVAQSSRGWTPTDPGEVERRQIVEVWASVSW